jgi:hypothetical protein
MLIYCNRMLQKNICVHLWRRPLSSSICLISMHFSPSQWSGGLRHKLSSPAPTLRSWVRIPLTHGCLCVFCVRFFCFYIVSSETTSRPKKRLMRTYHCISLFKSHIQSANEAYRISVILIANERVKKKVCILRRCGGLKPNSVALVRERTIPTKRPPLVGEVSAKFCG